jgi:outer membrane protein assembly factor BamB
VFSTPTVAGDMLLIGSCAGTFYAFDKRNGHTLWSYNIHQDGNQTSFHGNPLVTNELVLVGTDKSCASGAIGHVYAFDRMTGNVRWKYRTAGTPTDIVGIGSTIYSATFVDELIALDVSDGRLLWKFATGTLNPDCALPPAPVVVGDRVFYTGLDGILYALDGHSGKLLWKHDLGKRVTTKLSVIDNSIYTGNSMKKLLRLSADDGHVQSELSLPAVPEGRIRVDGSALYIFLEDRDSRGGYLISADTDLSRIRWTKQSDREWSSEWPTLWNGLLLAGNCHGELHAFRMSDGAPQWSDRLKGCLRSIGTDHNTEQVYVGAQEGMVYAYSPPRHRDGKDTHEVSGKAR